MMQYWAIDISKDLPPRYLLELACEYPKDQKKHLLFRDRFNALKAALLLNKTLCSVTELQREEP
jgi:hypothetical protein